MIKVDIVGWQKFMESMRRKDIVDLVQKNRVDDEHSIREYFDGSKVVARMTTHDFLGKMSSCDCEQVFEVDKAIVDKTDYIYIATQEQLDEWDDSYNDMDSFEELGKIDAGWLK